MSKQNNLNSFIYSSFTQEYKMSGSQKLKWQLLLMTTGIFQSTQAASLRCYNGDLNDYQEAPLASPLPLLNTVYLNKSRPTVIYGHGYVESPESTDVEAVMRAYLENVDKNHCLVNWTQEASDGGLGSIVGYTYAVSNVKTVGEQLGEAVVDLLETGLNAAVHLVGHSLGAHVVGYAGETAKDNGHFLPLITGLDPAGPLFDVPVVTGLDASNAQFVVAIHTNPTKYGSAIRRGTVDFWVKYNILTGLQPGCPAGIYKPLSTKDTCSHQRSVYIFAESLGSPQAFAAAGASNCLAWRTGQNTGVIYIGEDTDTSAKGNYYLKTNGASPYGQGINGSKP